MKIEMESLYRQIFDTALIAIGITDMEGKFVLVNNTWCAQMGYSSEEAMSLTITDVTLHEDMDDSNINYQKLLNGDINNFQKKRRYQRKDKSSFWANLIVSCIKDKEGKITAILGLFHDIDAQIKSENSLKEINHALEAVNEQIKHANLEIHKKNEELQLAYSKLDELARTDKLTGLPNRRKLEEQLDIEVKRSIRSKREFSVCIGDIDDFKHINDTYGHDIGDVVLIELAKVFKESIRTTDITGRWGGEEFLFILPETPGLGALVLMERVRQFVCSKPVVKGDTEVKVSVTLGFSTFYPDSDIEKVIKQADLALYAGKKSGKNLAVSYTKQLEVIHSVQI